MLIEQETAKEIACRQSTVCAGCGLGKNIGALVCWDCFKYCNNPFKEFAGSFEEWLAVIKQ